MDSGFISYDQATGAAPFDDDPVARPATPAPAMPPTSRSTSPDVDDAGQPVLKVVRYVDPTTRAAVPPPDAAPSSTPAAPAPAEDAAAPVAPAPSAAAPPDAVPSNWISYEEAATPPTPHPSSVLSNAADDTYSSGFLKGLGTAAIKAAGNTIGFAGGLHKLTDYLVARGQHAITGEPVDAIMAKLAAAEAQSPLGDVDPSRITPDQISAPILGRTGEYAPTSEIGRLAQAGAEAAMSAVGPGAGAKAGTYGTVLRGAVNAAPINFVAGAGAQGATDATGDPLAGLAAGAAAPAAAHLGTAGISKVVGPAAVGTADALAKVPVLGPMAQDAAQSSVENAAAKRLLASASDPAAVKDALTAFDPTAAEVPGTMPTTPGLTRDPRLLQAEMTARGTGGANVEFNARDAAQNSARIAALQSIQPDGDVFRPGQFVTQNLQDVEAAAQRARDQLEAAHQRAVAARAQGNQAATDQLAQSFQAAHDRLLQGAQDAASPLGNLPPAEQIGAVLRTAQQEAINAAAEIHKGLYDAVDPDGTLTAAASPLKVAKATIADAIDPHAGVQPTGAEAKLWSDIDRMPDVVPFRSLQKLDSRVTAAMTDARRNPNPEDPEAISRLSQLKSATMSAIDGAAEAQHAHEAKLVQAGVMAPQDAMQARFMEALNANRAAQDDARLARVANAGGPHPPASGRGAGASPDGLGTADAAGSGPGSPADHQGVPAAARAGAQQPDVVGTLSYQAPAFGDRTVSAQMHAPETVATLGADVPGTVVRPFSGPLDPRSNLPQGIVAYHGTPHDFDRFSSEHIGTGEGNQAMGRGLYFAEKPGIGAGFREALKVDGDMRLGNQNLRREDLGPESRSALDHIKEAGHIDKAIAEARQASASRLRSGNMDQADFWAKRASNLEDWKAQGFALGGDGYLYQVRLNRDPEHFLDWERPLSEQSDYVKQAIASDPMFRAAVDEHLGRYGRDLDPKKASGGSLYTGLSAADPAAAADRLRQAGIAGITYLDSGSRAAGKGSRNYVTFNDGDIVITHRNGVPLARPASLPDMLKGSARGAFVKELTDAGLNPTSFSTDLKARAESLLNSGERVAHGRALEQAAISSDPKEVQDAIFGGSAQSRGGNVERDGGSTSDVGDRAREPAGQSQGSRQPSQIGRAPSEVLQPATPEARERLTAAKAAFAEFKRVHDKPIVRGPLETNGFAGQYTMPDSAIPSQWVVRGPKGFDVANAFLRASGGDPRAIAAMQDAILMPLRKGALSNGMVHPTPLARWKSEDEFGPALRALDGVSPGFSSRFDNAGRATQAVLDAGLEHQGQLKAFQQKAAARALTENAASKAALNAGLATIRGQLDAAKSSAPGTFAKATARAIAPAEVENVVGGMLKTGTGGAARMRSLVQSVSADPDALAGLRKAGVDWIVRTFLGATEAGASGEKQIKGASLIKFLIDSRDTLKELYPTGQVIMFGAVARSIETDARWIAATAPKNGPGSAKDLAPKISEAGKENVKHVSMGMIAMGGLEKGFEHGGCTGVGIAAATPAAYLVNVLRGAGIRRVDQLYREMLLDPELAKLMISKMPENLESSKWHALARAVRRTLINAPLADDAAKKRRAMTENRPRQ